MVELLSAITVKVNWSRPYRRFEGVFPDQFLQQNRDAPAEQFGDVLLKHWPALVDETGSFSTSTLASRITKTHDLMGGGAAVDSGATSAVTALGVAVDLLLAGDCDMMFCAVGQRRMGLHIYEALARG